MSKHVLVLGDLISDENWYCTATRLCPEAPAPVLVEQSKSTTPGGAGLVEAQLIALLGVHHVQSVFGSLSHKTRIFADGHLICRIDDDAKTGNPSFEDYALAAIREKPDLVVISNYGKHSFNSVSAFNIVNWANRFNIPVLLDAKYNWEWYPRGIFAYFPNQREKLPDWPTGRTVIQKLGGQGCSVNGVLVPPEREHAVKDTTGAGDCFLAAFAAAYLDYAKCTIPSSQNELIECAKFANTIAGRSVEFLGTKVIEP